MRRRHLLTTGLLVTLLMLGGWVAATTADAQVGATYLRNFTWQQYENGAMLFDPGDSSIHVLFGDGQMRYFRSTDYGWLPENPVWEAPPPGRLRPLLGFGKVWGNHATIRFLVGWATTPERGYTATVTRETDGFTFTGPNNERIAIRYSSGTWFYNERSPYPPTPTHTPDLPTGYIPPFSDGSQLASTYQAFEGGHMLWVAGTGDIFVLYNAGDYQVYHPYRYVTLPDNPRWNTPPPGRFQPIFGFGKVWYNHPNVRGRLGWATTPEQGRLTAFGRSDPFFSFGLPYGGFATLDSTRGTWALAVP